MSGCGIARQWSAKWQSLNLDADEKARHVPALSYACPCTYVRATRGAEALRGPKLEEATAVCIFPFFPPLR